MWKDLRMKELLELTEEQFEAYYRQELMEAGIPLVMDVPVKPTDNTPKKSATLFELHGMFFETNDQARAVRDKAIEMGVLNYGSYNKKDFRDNYSKMSVTDYVLRIEEVKVWPLNMSEDLAAIKDRYDDDLEAFEKANDIYQEWLQDRRVIRDRMAGEFEHYNTLEYSLKRLQKIFDTYLAEAEGDRRMAWKFFVKAYDSSINALTPKEHYGVERGPLGYFYAELYKYADPDAGVPTSEEVF